MNYQVRENDTVCKSFHVRLKVKHLTYEISK